MRICVRLALPNRRGAAAVELALVLPLLAVLVLGCVDFGRFAYHFIAVKNAARAGAAYAIMNPYLQSQEAAWKAKILAAAREEMFQQTGYNAADLTVVVTVSVEQTGLRRVYVEATYPFQMIASWPGLPANATLRRGVEMRAVR